MKFSQLKLQTPYLQHQELFYDRVKPMPLDKPYLISVNQDGAKLLGVDENLLEDEDLVEILNGTKTLEGSETFAMCYAGHQFGYFSPRLGDGRVINLGKVNGYNLQVKGSGLTLYSRLGDGRAVLRSSIREYLMSEAMYGLGIKTTRALALIGSDTDVARQKWEKGAIVLRLSPTWVRFGTFEFFNAQGKLQMLQELADYVLEESFPHLVGKEASYLEMYAELVKRTAQTVGAWQSVGFNHGVMNTDNMSIDGRTIDYGPFAFLDDYNPNYICNHTDSEGRYSFKSQPGIAKWNLECLAKAISPIADYETALAVLEGVFYEAYEDEFLTRMKKRIGLYEDDKEDRSFIQWMHRSLAHATIDYNQFFRKLSFYDGNQSMILEMAVSRDALQEWLDAYDARLQIEKLSAQERKQKMLEVNPKYILKNHILQEAIDKATQNDFTMIEDLLKVAHSPYQEHPELEYLAKSTPQKYKNIQLSCSS